MDSDCWGKKLSSRVHPQIQAKIYEQDPDLSFELLETTGRLRQRQDGINKREIAVIFSMNRLRVAGDADVLRPGCMAEHLQIMHD